MPANDDSIDSPLWDLLGQVPEPAAPGRFSDDVLRRIRLSGDNLGDGPFIWLARSWRMLGGITAGTALLAAAVCFQTGKTGMADLATQNPHDLSALLASAPVNDVVDLGDLDISVDDNELWLGSVSY